MLLRRSHVLRNVGLALTLCCCALVSFMVQPETRLAWCLLGMSGLVLVFLGRDGGVGRVPVRVGPGGISEGGKAIAPRRTIRSGWVERSFDGTRVHLDRGVLPNLELDVADEAEAATILRVLGCDPSQTVVRFPAAPAFALVGAAGAFGQFCGHALPGGSGHVSMAMFLLGVAVCLLWSLGVVVLGLRETVIGSDGVLIAGLLRNRFLPFGEIDEAFAELSGRLVVRTRSGDHVVRRMREHAAGAAAELIHAAIASPHDGSETVRVQLRQEGEASVVSWLARLRALAKQEPYRATVFGGDALWRVVDDPCATGVERTAAAVVLGAAASPADRARLRDAAARIASPRVRMAIQQVTEGADEAELAVALEAVAHDSVA